MSDELKRLTRRGFMTMAVTGAAGYLGYEWIRTRAREGDVPWPLRRVLEANEHLAEAYFSPKRLSPEFDRSQLTKARVNGGIGLKTPVDMSTWRLRIEGAAEAPPALSMDDLRQFPKHTQITELRCIEGWSIIVQWSGARLADVMARFPPPQRTRYVALETPDRAYYVGLDFDSAMHPQTLLAYELNGAPLNQAHGAPLRLAIPVKYGIKNIKRIGTIRYTDVRPADFWGERGYDWYAGH